MGTVAIATTDTRHNPQVSLNEASERFVKGFLEIRNWFRLTAVPD